MKIKYYFAKDFQTSDSHELESLRTRYYQCRKEEAIEVVINMAKEFKCKVKSVDEERGEIIFDHMDYNACATITSTSYFEQAIDFNMLAHNILPTAFGKKVIEKFYKHIDSKLKYKGSGLYK